MTPERTCIGCRRKSATANLARIAWSDTTGAPVPDPRGSGRGAWLHLDADCAALVGPDALSRALRRAVGRVEADNLLARWPTMVGWTAQSKG
ncbi:MAG: DUF448 domain-containing protein [Actinobacteria bacterium]|nr:DUF448 domain-containing protein [Actinomycetota bacterium]MBT3686775.1 DUF448 domain-containing protein [Actinomycetota bacterium]MBT4037601.1 DUF448 domain-containing protein [Actinomycetota bacterium]MBT4278764.1 DUF448 domain-containing protein [Actinomycetota bacterium]MBT4343528.1 DUF448 domain-containing protein [Actinomycetota bacterium]